MSLNSIMTGSPWHVEKMIREKAMTNVTNLDAGIIKKVINTAPRSLDIVLDRHTATIIMKE